MGDQPSQPEPDSGPPPAQRRRATAVPPGQKPAAPPVARKPATPPPPIVVAPSPPPPIVKHPAAAPPIAPPLSPAQTLPYAAADRESARPALLTITGVFAVLVGLVTVGWNVAVGIFFGWVAIHSTRPAPPAPAAPLPAIVVTPLSAHPNRPGGLSPADRLAHAKDLTFDGPFAQDRAAMFDRLLADAGETIGSDFRAADPTTQPTDDVAWNALTFSNSRGTLRVDKTSAEFQPSDGSPKTQVIGARVMRNGAWSFSAGAVEAKLAELRQGLPVVTDLQAGRLYQLLDTPCAAPRSLQYAPGAPQPRPTPGPISSGTPGAFMDEGLPLFGCNVVESTVLRATVNGIPTYILADGRSVPMSAARFGIDAVNGSVRPTPPPMFVPAMRAPLVGMWLLAGHAAASVIISFLLIAAGFATFTGRPGGGAWYVRWVGFKLVLFVAVAAILTWFLPQFQGVDRSFKSVEVVGSWLNVAMISATVVGMVFPVVVLCLMFLSGSVRQYYARKGIHLPMPADVEQRCVARPALRAALFGLIGLGAIFSLWNVFVGAWLDTKLQLVLSVLHVTGGGVLLLVTVIALRRLLNALRERRAE